MTAGSHARLAVFVPSPVSPSPSPPTELALAAIRLSAKIGALLEVMKKGVRDGSPDTEKLTRTWSEAFVAWQKTRHGFGLSPRDGIAANVTKLEDRRARKVLRGGGNYR